MTLATLADRLIYRARCKAPDLVVGSPKRPYMHRWWLIPRNPVFNVYLHRFLRSDDDRALHDHPWPSLSILLHGSYREHVERGASYCAVHAVPTGSSCTRGSAGRFSSPGRDCAPGDFTCPSGAGYLMMILCARGNPTMTDPRGVGSEWEQLAFAELLASHVLVEPAGMRTASPPPPETYEECLASARQLYTGRATDSLLRDWLRLRQSLRAHGPKDATLASLQVIDEILGMDP